MQVMTRTVSAAIAAGWLNKLTEIQLTLAMAAKITGINGLQATRILDAERAASGIQAVLTYHAIGDVAVETRAPVHA